MGLLVFLQRQWRVCPFEWGLQQVIGLFQNLKKEIP